MTERTCYAPHYDPTEVCDCQETLAAVDTHTRINDPRIGPPYCEDCSAAVAEWITWPCPGVRATMPKRIQRQRTKGWKMPEGAIYVGRPTKWGNPYVVDAAQTTAAAVRAYRWLLTTTDPHLEPIRPPVDQLNELQGKDLACWCPLDQPCHADVLLEIANAHNESHDKPAEESK